MFLPGEISVKKNIIVNKGFSEDYMSKKGKIVFLIQFLKIDQSVHFDMTQNSMKYETNNAAVYQKKI